ncbi:MAG: phosphate acyltransferase PlsX [SAR324 cluster bacterium]|nr:phosphate acyltransferase PlsX [SAR324 cluster bacterium]
MVIALDAMGGDFAPLVPIKAAIKAKQSGVDVILVGNEKSITKHLLKEGVSTTMFKVVNADEVISMQEVIGAKTLKKNSSLRVCYELKKKGAASAVVSAGHSGAMLALGKMILKTINLIDRPCIGALMPSKKGHVLLADAGANIDCSADNLFQFGILAKIYLECVHNVNDPKLGLLNIGKEKSKGPAAIRDAYSLFEKSDINFLGNIEGKEFFLGDHDIVICDGFAGNILLKSTQGAEAFISYLVKEQIGKSWLNKLGALLLSGMFKGIKDHTNYAKYGGAPLLGLNGVAMVCHGNSNVEAIFSAIKIADWSIKNDFIKRIIEGLDFHYK